MLKPTPSKPGLFSVAYKRFSRLRGIAVVTLLTVGFVMTYLVVATPQAAYATTTATLNFQARLESSSGAIAPDGTYNVTFHIFNASSSSGSTDTACSTDANCLWEESYTYNSGSGGTDARIHVANGYLTVNLGSITAFPSTINWDQQLYLTMDIGGVVGSGTITWDGQMSPRLPLTAVPYAFRAGALASNVNSGGYDSTLTMVQPASGVTGNEVFQVQDQGAAGTYSLLTGGSISGATAGVVLQSGTPGTQQSGNFNVSGTGIVGTELYTPIIDAATSGGTLYLGSGNAASGSVTVGYGMGSGAINIGGGGQTGTINVGRSTATNTINIGNAIGASATQTINIGTSSSGTDAITVGSSSSGSTTNLQAGATSELLANSGATIQTTTNTPTALQVKSSGGTVVLGVDTSNDYVNVTGPVLQTGLKTTYTSNTYNGQWTELGACTITSQYSGCSTVINIVGGMSGGSADNSQAQVGFRVYQQNTMPGNPAVTLNVGANAELITASSFVAVVSTETSGQTVVQLWAQVNHSYESWDYTPSQISIQGGNASLSWTPYSAFQASQPTSTYQSTTATYNDVIGSTLSIQGTNNTSAVNVQNSSGYNVFNVNSGTTTATSGTITLGNITTTSGAGVAGTLALADGTIDGFGATINTSTLTANQAITLPNSSGTICLTSQNCSTAGSGYILNQSGTPGSVQTGNFNISGTGIATDFDSTASGTLNLGTTNASTINVGTNAAAHTIAIGNGAAAETITLGSTNTTSTTTIQGGSGNINLNGFTKITTAGVPLEINTTGAAGTAESGLIFQTSGTNEGEVGIAGSTGHIINQAAVNDLALKSINGNVLFAAGGSSVDLTLQSNGNLVLNSGVLVLQNTGTAPTEVDGGMYYNSSLGQFQCGTGGNWLPCDGAVNVQSGQSGWIDSYPTCHGTWCEFGGGTDTTYTAPAGDCQSGVAYRVRASGTYNDVATWAFHVGLYDNGSEIQDTGNVSPPASTEQNESWDLDLTITCYSTTNVYIQGTVTWDNNSNGSVTSMISTGTAGRAWSSGSNTIGVGWYWNSEQTGSGLDTAQMDQFIVQRLD